MSESELSLRIGILGGNHEITKLIGDALGSPGTQSDLIFYNRLDNGLRCIFTAVAPIGYPDKVKSLLQACAISQIHIMVIDAETGINAETGEIMVAMDLYGRYFGAKGIAVIGNITNATEWRVEELQKQLPKLLAPTFLKDIELIPLKERADYDHLKKQILEIGKRSAQPSPESPPYAKVLIDHVFPVKGVGTVVLGLVSQGQIAAGEMYDLIPVQKKIILRSIQKQDRDFKTAEVGDRVGLALKGVRHEDVDRNAVFCSLGAFQTSKEFKAKVKISPYYKPGGQNNKVSPNEPKNYHLIADLAISVAKLTGGDEIPPGGEGFLNITLEKELAHDAQGLKGIIAEFGAFEKKLRIAGYFEQIL